MKTKTENEIILMDKTGDKDLTVKKDQSGIVISLSESKGTYNRKTKLEITHFDVVVLKGFLNQIA